MSEHELTEQETPKKGKNMKAKKVEAEIPEQKKTADANDEAMKRICKAMGLSYEDVLAREKAEKEKPPVIMVDVSIGRERVRINGQVYTGTFRCSRDMADGVLHMVNSRRTRHLNEKIGKNHEVIRLANGAFGARVVEVVNEHGEKV